MNRLFCCAVLPLMLVGCGSEPVYLSSGTYMVQDQELAPVPAEVLDLVFEVDVDALTITMFADTLETTAQLTEQPKRHWPGACETMFESVALQAFELDQDLELAGESLTSPRLAASGCQGDEGTFASAAQLTTTDWENESAIPSFGTLTLELIED